MENLAETGKRLERLFYSSVLVMIASFFFYFLSSAIASDATSSKKTLISNFIISLNKKKQNLEIAKTLQETYKKYSEENKNKTEKQKKEDEENRRLRLKKINETRIRLGLTKIEIEKKEQVKSTTYDGLDIKNIDTIRKNLSLTESGSIKGAERIYEEGYYFIVYKELYGDGELTKEFIGKAKAPLADIIKDANSKLTEFDKGSVKVFDVDTPIQIPFSLGDLKSKVSLYNIETVGLIFMPVLLIIWVGSISMTRAREIFFIQKTKNIAETYPHILNLYFFIDRDTLEKQADISNFDQIKNRNLSVIKSSRPLAIIYFIFRMVILTLLLLSITVPFYAGVYNIMDSLSAKHIFCIYICLVINVIQGLFLILSEGRIFKTIFTAEGTTHESI